MMEARVNTSSQSKGPHATAEGEDHLRQVERRPPLYNAEDYVSGLKRFCKLTGLQMYLADATSTDNSPDGGNTNDSKKSAGKNRKEHGGGDGSGGGGGGGPDEMGLRQFSSVSELLSKLKSDLNTSLASFRREFVCAEENDGVTLLLDLLKAIQLAQTNITGSLNQLGSRANHVMFKRALADEFEALLCLRACARAPENGAGGAEDGAARLAAHPSGLFTVAVCVMSNYSKSRVLSLQLLARLCEMEGGHKQVSDAISMLRLRFGEPVRFKFLVGMLNSYNSAVFQVACLRFLNRFVETCKDARERIMVQTELEEAGFDVTSLKRFLGCGGSASEGGRGEALLREEMGRWATNYIDVNNLVRKLLEAERANKRLREEVSALKEKQKTFEAEKQRNLNTVDRLKECCGHLQEEIDKRTKHKQQRKSSGSNFATEKLAKSKEEKAAQTASVSSTSSGSQQHHLERSYEDCETFDDEDADDEDVLLLLPSNINERDLHLKNPKRLIKRSKSPPNGIIAGICGGVSISDDSGDLVTVLATDGYTCVTSPSNATGVDKRGASSGSNHVSSNGQQIVGISGDSGLSSEDSSEKSSTSPAANKKQQQQQRTSVSSSSAASDGNQEMEEGQHFDCKSSYTSSSAKSDHGDGDVDVDDEEDDDDDTTTKELYDDLEAMYAERNVLHEEETTVEAERISIGGFRLRFCDPSSCTSKVTRLDTPDEDRKDKKNLEDNQQEKACLVAPPPTPSRNKPVISDVISSQALELSSSSSKRSAPLPKPPIAARRRPSRSSPPGMGPRSNSHHKSVSDMMEERKREMVYLPDLTSGDKNDVRAPQSNNSDSNNTSDIYLSSANSSTNTMETISARSFGFVKPSPRQREKDFVNRLRRHKSFFAADTSEEKSMSGRVTDVLRRGAGGGGGFGGRGLMRRAESFSHHEDNLEHYRPKIRGKSVERLDGGEGGGGRGRMGIKSLSKSKSMEFLKAKLLSRRPSSANKSGNGIRISSQSPTPSALKSPTVDEWAAAAAADRRSDSPGSGGGRNWRRSSSSQDVYDWRQDTPFWNKQGRWARPAAAKKAAAASAAVVTEEPWVNHHHPLSFQQQQQPPVRHHPLNGGAPPARIPGSNWQFPPSPPIAAAAGPPSMLFGRSKAFYPSFPGGTGHPPPPHPLYLPHFVPRPFNSGSGSSGHGSAASSGSGGGGGDANTNVRSSSRGCTNGKRAPAPPLPQNKPRRFQFEDGDCDGDDLSSRLEITELSDEDPLVACPTPDYSTMKRESEEQVEEAPGNQLAHLGKPGRKRNILDMPSGLY